MEDKLLEEEAEEIVCKPLRDDDFSGSIDMLKNGEDGGLRCRFSRPSAGSLDVKGVCEMENLIVRCSCDRQAVTGHGTSVSIVFPNGKEVACVAVLPGKEF